MSAFKWQCFAVTAIAALACAAAVQAQIPERAPPSWLLKPAVTPVPNWYEVRGGAWPVPAVLVEEMASRIKAEVGSSVGARLDTYVIQYQGESAGGSRSVRLVGACATRGVSGRALSERFHVVMDGGRCYFDATYDPEGKRFTSLTYHGHA